MLNMAKRLPIVLCGPSGVGKSTLIARLRAEFPNDFGFSVSHTTRAPRAGEKDGVDYWFVSDKASMEKDIAEGKFVESANVHGNLYGTSFAAVDFVSTSGKVCILDIDVQGVASCRRVGFEVDKYIFVAPPDISILESRLRGRGTDSEESVTKRLANASKEINAAKVMWWNGWVVNDSLSSAYEQLRSCLNLQPRTAELLTSLSSSVVERGTVSSTSSSSPSAVGAGASSESTEQMVVSPSSSSSSAEAAAVLVTSTTITIIKKRSPIILCGPSGVGKSTLIARLRAEFPNDFGFSVSHTTRTPRAGEKDGVDYWFVSDKASMEKDIAEGKFVESANVHGNLYGTSFAAVDFVSTSGKVCILDIDVQGVASCRRVGFEVDKYIFVAPPDISILESRLRGRGTDSEESVTKRLANASKEINAGTTMSWDSWVVNDDLDRAYAQLKGAIF